MSWTFSSSDIKLHNPYPAGQPFQVIWEVRNGDQDQPTHTDHVNIWDGHSNKVLDEDSAIEDVPAGSEYMSIVEVPALQPGYYDIAITIGDSGASAGSTIIVE